MENCLERRCSSKMEAENREGARLSNVRTTRADQKTKEAGESSETEKVPTSRIPAVPGKKEEIKLPYNQEAILKKNYWVDRKSNRICYMLFAKDLAITWAEDKRYWIWQPLKETNSDGIDVAMLLNVCWLDVQGKCNTAKLSPETLYKVVFVVMLKDSAYGWEVPVNIRLTLPDGSKQERKENLRAKLRGEWIEIPVGEFKTPLTNAGKIEFSMYEHGGHWKRGLVIKGAIIQPKDCYMLFAKDLAITWAEDKRYWIWQPLKETNSDGIDVAVLLNVCWLDVHGKFDTAKLSPETLYKVVFVVLLKDSAYGWEVPVNIRLTLPDGSKQERKENLRAKPRVEWIEIPVGEFKTPPTNAGKIEFSMYEHGGHWKRGLVIKGAIIQPKN